jgi:hypothetical protein
VLDALELLVGERRDEPQRALARVPQGIRED